MVMAPWTLQNFFKASELGFKRGSKNTALIISSHVPAASASPSLWLR